MLSHNPVLFSLSFSDKQISLAIDGVIAFDAKNNLVILKVSGEGIPILITDSDTVSKDEPVSVVGYANEKNVVKTGTVERISKSNKWFWMSVPAAKESSGGAVLNSKGEVIGINVRYANTSHGYAIPSNALKALLKQPMPLEPLMEWQKRKQIRAEAYHSHGEEKSLKKEYDKAVVDFDKVIQENPKHVRAYYKRGRAKYYINDYIGAIDDISHAIQINREHVRAYKLRGGIQYKLGESKFDDGNVEKALTLYKKAIDDYSQAIKIDPDDPSTYRNRSIARCILGDLKSTLGDSDKIQWLYHEGIADHIKYIQLTHSKETDTQTSQVDPKKGRASTVRIAGWHKNFRQFYSGSGFFVDTDKIATNIHVVAGPGPVVVKLINKDAPLEVLGVTAFDMEYDLVILQVKGEGTPLPLGDSNLVQSGEPIIIIIGYPNEKYKVTTGNVQGIRKTDNLMEMIAGISKGNSGSPVLNDKGEVVGIITRSGASDVAIPSNIINRLLTQTTSPISLTQWQKHDHIRAYAYISQGQIWFNTSDYTKAKINFDKAISHDPEFSLAYFWRGRVKDHLGQSSVGKGNLTVAQQLYTEAIQDYTRYRT